MVTTFPISFELFHSEDGGVLPATRLPSGTPSIIMTFGPEDDAVSFGGRVFWDDMETAGAGDSGTARVAPLAPEAIAGYAIPGAEFHFWYGRVIGTGRVLEDAD